MHKLDYLGIILIRHVISGCFAERIQVVAGFSIIRICRSLQDYLVLLALAPDEVGGVDVNSAGGVAASPAAPSACCTIAPRHVRSIDTRFEGGGVVASAVGS